MSRQGKAGIAAPSASAAVSTTAAPASTGVAGKPASVGRDASRARRQAMSTQGKAALNSTDRVRGAAAADAGRATTAAEPRDTGCGCGCKGEPASAPEKTSAAAAGDALPASPAPKYRGSAKPKIAANPSRAASLARRRAQSIHGKAGVNARGMTPAQTARAANPQLSGRELAQSLREQRSQKGGAGQKKSEPTGRMRPARPTAGAAQDASWKVGASETSHGQTVTGTLVGRSAKTTGDEPSTCRGITGTEYLGADIFREFCQAEPGKGPQKVSRTSTAAGNRVTGNELGRSKAVTGDEPGTCKRVTGVQYVGAEQAEAFCGSKPEAGPAKVTQAETRKGKSVTGSNVGRSAKVTGDESGADRELTGSQYGKRGEGKAPAKVGASSTLRGGSVTGTMVGRSGKVTGDEPGSCKAVTGDDYVGQEHYQSFCAATPAPQDAKVGSSQTLRGESVTGTLTGRSGKVTGDEPGTCKSITGTPYAGAEQYRSYCKPEETRAAELRTRPQRGTPGSVMTGLQPGIGGKATGDARGACEPLTGTPYVGADQFAAACPATPAEPGSPDFPQPLEATPWGQFSVAAPAHAAQGEDAPGAVTGTRYEQGQITGPFGMASGKVTGTEDARFGQGSVMAQAQQSALPPTAGSVDGRVKSRITGEGMAAGGKITGDDWERGDHVTGTEGSSSMRRNPTRRGSSAGAGMPAQPAKRNDEVAEPVSKVTGGSGNTEKGALVTYSGGARG